MMRLPKMTNEEAVNMLKTQLRDRKTGELQKVIL